ncbi:YcaO-like family protein [Synechococcus sp. CBW1002]|uniref:YcaO-like family protein n=1 Tax=Synechococcus sp. CBW1002 TaxID=1353134 RepID=UPI0018CD4BF3|nr:YcaO-like family protein [Synechococcus sp. CBW1002]QPN58443.1 YcaO-like family protein [Synechococcus sp. CBW1002]
MEDLKTSLRTQSAATTIDLVSPYLEGLGIVGVIDHTSSRIPELHVFEALRNNAHSGYLNLGKGYTAPAATASAIMEGIEMSLIESPRIKGMPRSSSLEGRTVRFRDAECSLSSNLEELIVSFIPCKDLISNATCFVPDCDVFYPVALEAGMPLKSFTNGLASGNTLEEAMLHSLYELIERDAMHNYLSNPDSANPICSASFNDQLLDSVTARLADQGHFLILKSLRSKAAAVFEATLFIQAPDETYRGFNGWGCNHSPLIAARRAIAEAAQVWRIQEAINLNTLPASRRKGGYVICSDDYLCMPRSHLNPKPMIAAINEIISRSASGIVGMQTADSDLSVDPSLLVSDLIAKLAAINVAGLFCVRLSPEELPVHVVRCFSSDLNCPIGL